MRRAISVLVSAALLFCCFVARAEEPKEDKKSAEAESAEALRKLGCKIEVNDKALGKPVIGVSLFQSGADDDDLAHLANFPKLEKIYAGCFEQSGITDRG